jgi:probable phosphoglycerate mutase
VIIIIRHGETFWNLKKKKQGQKNSNLTKKGKKQATKVARFLKKNSLNLKNFKIYCSPLKRVLDFIKIIDKNLDHKVSIKKISIKSKLLKEHKFGKWEGKTDKQIKKLFPNEFNERKKNRWGYIVPKGESYALLKLRVENFIKKNIKKNKNYIIFTHEMVSKVFRGIILKMNNQKILFLKHKQDSVFVYKNKFIKEYKI